MRGLAVFLLNAAVLMGAECVRTSVGFPPLDDPFLRSYRGFPLGLYPEGSNRRPAENEALGLKLAAEVVPRDGKIVLLSVGMSNTTQEFAVFKQMADRDPDKNPQVVLVDGAQGGWSADRIVADPAAYWRGVDERLGAAGVTAAQVQAAWIKLADSGPNRPFPEDARKLQGEWQEIVLSLRPRFPNLRLAYLSSRIYGGYASTALNPEPYAYQGGFAVKWLIERQIQGQAELDAAAGQAPWMAWGPYLWADGVKPRYDGLGWTCSDLGDDGTHPSVQGRQKVARLLLDFFKSDTTARPWFVRPAAPAPLPKAAAVVNAASGAAQMATGSIASIYGSDLAGAVASAPAVPLPRTLAGTRVEVGGEPVPLYYVSPGQINFVLPPAAADWSVVVVREQARSQALPFSVSLYAPGIFTLDGRPEGPAAALHAGGRTVSTRDPARPGETIEIYATGRGVRNPLLKMPELAPVVLVGGLPAQLQYAGPAPAWPGLDQYNVTVPADAPAGDAVTVELRFGSSASNRATLAVGR